MIKIPIEFLEPSFIEKRTLDILEEFEWQGKLPIDIELLVEKRGIYFTLSSEIDSLAIDSFVSNDLKTIYINTFIFEHETRCRFSIAHELGHIILHGDFIKAQNYSTPEEWKKIQEKLDPDDVNKMEVQAKIFAPYILMPTQSVLIELESYFRQNPDIALKLASNMDLFEDDENRKYISEMIAQGIAQVFYVSQETMKWRLYNNKYMIVEVLKSFD